MSVFLILVISASTAHAFNDQRRGFILGGGIGLGITDYIRLELGQYGLPVRIKTVNAPSVVTDFKIGHASSEQFMLYYFSHVTWYRFSIEGTEMIPDASSTVATGVSGLGITYFLEPTVPSAFVEGGGGFATHALPFDGEYNEWSGYGFWFGGGYEFSRHWSADLGVNVTIDDPQQTASPSLSSFGITLNYLAY